MEAGRVGGLEREIREGRMFCLPLVGDQHSR
jgi:hypothetical protein